MLIELTGKINNFVAAKDVILKVISEIGTSAGTGHVIEFAGSALKKFSMEERMTICNMSIEAGAKAGMMAPDSTTFEYLKNKDYSPKGILWDEAKKYWKKLNTDQGATYDTKYSFDLNGLKPQITWGTSPEDGISISDQVPDPKDFLEYEKQKSIKKSLDYMDLKPGTKMTDVDIQKVFIGSCTNGRLEDLRTAAAVIKGRKVSKKVQAIIVPGSGVVKENAEKEGLKEIFIAAGFEWREPGCSMCLGMNPDQLAFGERCASTSNRNFEGRQGRGGRTHLVSPATAAASAIEGRFVDLSLGF